MSITCGCKFCFFIGRNYKDFVVYVSCRLDITSACMQHIYDPEPLTATLLKTKADSHHTKFEAFYGCLSELDHGCLLAAAKRVARDQIGVLIEGSEANWFSMSNHMCHAFMFDITPNQFIKLPGLPWASSIMMNHRCVYGVNDEDFDHKAYFQEHPDLHTTTNTRDWIKVSDDGKPNCSKVTTGYSPQLQKKFTSKPVVVPSYIANDLAKIHNGEYYRICTVPL